MEPFAQSVFDAPRLGQGRERAQDSASESAARVTSFSNDWCHTQVAPHIAGNDGGIIVVGIGFGLFIWNGTV